MFKQTIKKRTYRNFMLVMKEIIAKGYDHDTAWNITNHLFEEIEYNPKGMSIKQRIGYIREADDSNEVYMKRLLLTYDD